MINETAQPYDLDLLSIIRLLHGRELSASELIESCLGRIESVDGAHSFEGDPASINAWARVYGEDARLAAKRCDQRLSAASVRNVGAAPRLCGVPIALKDMFAVAGKPLTGSSRVMDALPARDSDVWAHLDSAGAVLLGHTHTHEFAAGCTTDQVGNPWNLSQSAGGSSGGSAAVLAARMVPAAVGTDTAGSLRIPSALCGTSAIKPTGGLVSLAGVVPLARSLDNAGPMARTVTDCAILLEHMVDTESGGGTRSSSDPERWDRRSTKLASPLTVALSPQLSGVTLHPDVADGLDEALAVVRTLAWSLVSPGDPAPSSSDGALWRLQNSEIAAHHEQFNRLAHRYRPSTRQLVEAGRLERVSKQEYTQLRSARRRTTGLWKEWFTKHDIDFVLEPTVTTVAPERGNGYTEPEAHVGLLSLTHLWNWTQFPVVALPVGIGARSGLPVGVSLIGLPGTDAALLHAGAQLQRILGVPRTLDLEARSSPQVVVGEGDTA